MKRFRDNIFLALVLLIAFTSSLNAREILRLATTTSTYETGILDYIIPVFEKRNNCKVHIISVGTGKAIQLGKNGDVDVILVHARDAEDRFLNEGYGVNRRDVMYNDFVILGPGDDPAKIEGLKDTKEAFKRIFYSKAKFISRGDDSGTDKKEKSLWAITGLNPDGGNYLETGQGMSATLRVADEKNAYILVDRATYMFNRDNIRLKKLIEGDSDLFNPYGVIPINPEKHPHVKYKLSMDLVEWLIAPECQRMINQYEVKGRQLFHSNEGD